MANGNFLSIFPGFFSRIVKVTHFFQVINFRKRAHGKIHPRKLDKNNRESTFVCFVSSFLTHHQNKVYCPFFNTTAKVKSLLSLLFCSLCFSNGLKCLYKHSINAKYIKQWLIFHFKRYIWLETFRYNCTQSQLNNEGRGELHEVKRSRDKTEIGKEIIWQRVKKYHLKSLAHEIVLRHKK